MAYVNLPPNLQDMFYTLSDRISKLETGPSEAMYTATSAQSTATSAAFDASAAYAQSIIAGNQATQAALQAGVAQTTADGKNTVHYSTSAPGSTANKVGDIWYQYGTGTYSNQVIAQWSGAGGTSWTSVQVSGLVIANIDAGTIKTGTLTSIAIYAGSSGQFQVSAAGALTATAATVQGTITANTLTTNNGTIGGWNIGTTGLYTGSISSPNNFLSNSGGALFTGTTTCSSFQVNSTTLMSGNLTVSAYIYNSGHPTTTSTANAFLNSSTGLLARSTSSQRYKVEIQSQEIPLNSVLALQPKSYVDKADAEANGTPDGLPRYLGLIAEDVVQIPVLGDLLANKDDEGRPDSVNYDRIAVALIPILKEHEARLNKLEGK